MRKVQALALVLVLSTPGLTSAIAATAPKPGTKCTKEGLIQSANGKKYTCIKLGAKLYWNNGVKISVQVNPRSTPTPAPLNEILGVAVRQDDLGRIFQTVLVKEIKTERIGFAGDSGTWNSAYSTNFKEQDLFKDYILGCPKSADCTQSTYISKLNQKTATEVNFGSITHPGNFAAVFLKEADFGSNQDIVFAHLKFSSRGDGASDLIVRYDVATKTITPIFVTYCNSLGTGAACSSGASISGLRVSKKLAAVYFVLNQGILDINNLKSTQSLVSIPMDAPAQRIGTPADSMIKSYDGYIKDRFVYTHSDASTTIGDLDLNEEENQIFLITRSRKDVGTNNGFCKISITSGIPSCAQLEPFDFIGNLIVINKNAFLYESFSGITYYDFISNKSSPVSNTYKVWLLDVSK